MSRKFLHFVLLAAFVAVSSLALAADPPTLVGRISAAEGQVTVQTDDGDETGSLLNWPVKGGDRITTARGARTEFRVGPVAVRLDGDSALDIEELDEDVMRLRLEHGAASVRVRDPQALSGFELATPHGRVLLTEPGTVRVDTGREPDTTTVAVLMGIARLEAAGTALTLRTGKRAEIRGDDVRTGQALQDSFDSWAFARDRRDDAAIATRYIPNYVTGYEELDQYGSWTVNDEYGPLWAPRSVSSGWSPYSDGRWAWVAPWGWTWVDNAPWGYAPFHYGRWVMVDRRWCWAPGRIVGRPVWAPALVGWVGGAGWSVAFNDRRHRPGLGWYPLTPRDRYVPHYQVSPDHERRLGWQYRGGNERWKSVQVRREGVTIVPRDQFEGRRSVRVNNLPRASVAANPGSLPSAAPVVPGFARAPDRNRDGIADRLQTDRNRDGIADRAQINRPQAGGLPMNQPQVNRLQTDRDNDGTPDRLQGGRDRESIADRPQTDRNRDGMPDRLQGDRSRDSIANPAASRVIQTDRNADGTPDRNRDGVADRFQADRNIDSVAERMQRERNEAPLRGPGVIVNERPRVERQIERPRVERQIERPASQPVFNAPAPAPMAAQPAPAPQPAPQPVLRPQVQPSREIVGNERMERQREMMQERAEARQEMEIRRQAIAQQRMSAPQQAPAPAPQPRPEPVAQPRPAPMAQPAPAAQPAAQPAVQPRGGRPDRPDRDGGRER
ncbi:hypothetical protein GJV26_13960 [Massilia dura]|uniref:FecR protein domain-containing protein n=1 Tax=Pseudoduganella dura TaxID=321982 RepID=A0A6I3X9M3_9BURK|nr:DUF6600 domain-containing protein [Pseudoduganella dura]MUI13559.1 hypothetical protein [Pseudoduganella dura]GGX73722.1 hypothetical protein GCM10007386_00690 [Pseudoduganella dura]